jgi:cysteinyl-tRNA synthetase
MGLRLYNTLTRTKDDFVPIDPANVRMYVCGPTVYDFAHIGNARPLIVFDVLFRLLRHLYGPDHVTYVRNITDVDDKINARAAEEYPDLPLNEAIRLVTERTTEQFHEDVAALGCLPPTVEPRATEHIAEMKAMIETLVAKGFAYVSHDHVLFHVAAMKDYGRLSNRSLDEMIAGARVEVAPYKRDPMDFVLWKPSKPGEPAWDSPAGIASPGRPGWHLECSAMSDRWLWQEALPRLSAEGRAHPHEFDIHGGGIDLVFPHHENEIAQSRCAHGTDVMARTWLHNGFLQVEGEKMSKSLGNFVTIRELLQTEKFGGRRWPGEVLRLAMLMTHYREPIDFSLARLREADAVLYDWRRVAKNGQPEKGTVSAEVIAALSDDLDFHAARMTIDRLLYVAVDGAGELLERQAARDQMAATLLWLGLLKQEEFQSARRHASSIAQSVGRAIEFVDAFNKYAQDELSFADFEALRRTVDPFDLNSSIESRLAHIRDKKWSDADRIREELHQQGIQLKDGKDPATGERMTTWEVKR